MFSEKPSSFVYFLAIICLIIGTVCYALLPPPPPGEPVRIHFENVGGNVLFDHSLHAGTYELSCSECHHDRDKEGKSRPLQCGSCHKEEEGPRSFGEGGLFDHDLHVDNDCADCHHEYSESSGDDPLGCSDCHSREHSGETELTRQQIFHRQCIGCHEENDVTPGGENCSGCHHPRKKMNAFHDGCIGCHENIGAGPTGSDTDCKYCHGY